MFTSRGKQITKTITKKLLNNERVLLKDCKKKDGSGTYHIYLSVECWDKPFPKWKAEFK